jgi:hypothetical protein
MVTRAVAALGAETQREIVAALRRYDEFDADNDPYGGTTSAGSRSRATKSYSKSIITTRISRCANSSTKASGVSQAAGASLFAAS